MMAQTYIFDLDGTLLDTLADLAASVNYALRTHHMPERSLDDVRRFVGNGVRLLIIRAVPDGEQNPQFEAAFQTFREHYMAHSLDTTHPYDGIPELLAELAQRTAAGSCREESPQNSTVIHTYLLKNGFPDPWRSCIHC